MPDFIPATPETETPAIPPFESQQPSTAHWLFFGPEGLRAGWSLLLYLLLVVALTFAAQQIVHLIRHAAHSDPPSRRMTAGTTFYGEAAGFAVFALAAWIMGRIERRPFGVFGLGGRRKLAHLCGGVAWGVLAISLLIGALYAAHLLAFDGVALHGSLAWIDGAKWALAFLFVGFLEEFMTRGYVQYTAARGIASVLDHFTPRSPASDAIGFWIAAFFFSALVFMGLHTMNHGETAVGILAVGVAGLTFAYSLWRTGALWWAIGFHASWDWAQSYLYGVADSGGMVEGHLLATHPTGQALLSGGTDGPEGSLFVIPTLLLVCLVIRLTLPRGSDPAPALYTQP
jgi:membrane protease YdiL (CAAX protease family)